MGREVKRVEAGFDWPIDKVWSGFLMPDKLRAKPCPEGGITCANGETAARAWVGTIARLLLLLDDKRAVERGKLHPYFDSISRPYGYQGESYRSLPVPTPDIAEFGAGLAGREPAFFGHDSIDAWTAQRKVIEAAGLDAETWGICPACGGEGSVEAYPGQAAEAEAWEPTSPPVGEWWQVWETVSEGSPVSPAFETPEELAHYLADNRRAHGSQGEISYAAALSWIQGSGHTFSMTFGPAGLRTGVESALDDDH